MYDWEKRNFVVSLIYSRRRRIHNTQLLYQLSKKWFSVSAFMRPKVIQVMNAASISSRV